MALSPTAAQLAALSSSDKPGPVYMLNLLTYKDVSEYAKYAMGVRSVLKRLGARVLWSGTVDSCVIGNMAAAAAGGAGAMGRIDAVGIVEYPSRAAFLYMVTQDEEYKRVHRHREKACS